MIFCLQVYVCVTCYSPFLVQVMPQNTSWRTLLIHKETSVIGNQITFVDFINLCSLCFKWNGPTFPGSCSAACILLKLERPRCLDLNLSAITNIFSSLSLNTIRYLSQISSVTCFSLCIRIGGWNFAFIIALVSENHMRSVLNLTIRPMVSSKKTWLVVTYNFWWWTIGVVSRFRSPSTPTIEVMKITDNTDNRS